MTVSRIKTQGGNTRKKRVAHNRNFLQYVALQRREEVGTFYVFKTKECEYTYDTAIHNVTINEGPTVLHGGSTKMHALRIISQITILLALLSLAQSAVNDYHSIDITKKCCSSGYSFNEQYKCTPVKSGMANKYHNKNSSSEEQPQIYECPDNLEPTIINYTSNYTYLADFAQNNCCVENLTSDTKVIAICPKYKDCRILFYDGLATVVFWGAKTYMPANIAHVFLCLIVLLIYMVVSEFGQNTVYNRAILSHNASLLTMGTILTLLGCCDLCNCNLNNHVIISLWLLLQFFTLASVFWLNVICFDMTTVITRFRWTPGSSEKNERTEYRKFVMYSAVAWGGAFIPTAIAGALEYIPDIPNDFPLKVNYLDFQKGPNYTVNLYFFGIPLITLFLNNILFGFTTFKIIRIQKSTKMVTNNQTNMLRKRYFLVLRLYLLMGAPWFFGILLACLNHLIVLKICRLIQPILWILMLISHRKVRRKIIDKFRIATWDDRQVTTTIT